MPVSPTSLSSAAGGSSAFSSTDSSACSSSISPSSIDPPSEKVTVHGELCVSVARPSAVCHVFGKESSATQVPRAMRPVSLSSGEGVAKALESRLRQEAKTIATSYLAPPHTTDFAILFLPVEGLYAEALRRPGLMDALQRDHRVTLACPTTLLALLNSLHMGFRTLALEQQASEVWKVLGAVKTEFERYGEWVAKVREQVHKAADTLDKADTRSKQMRRVLKGVEALPEAEALQRLPLQLDDGTDAPDLHPTE
mgnify:CR=1 FL=1